MHFKTLTPLKIFEGENYEAAVFKKKDYCSDTIAHRSITKTLRRRKADTLLQDQKRIVLIKHIFYFLTGELAFKPTEHFVQHNQGFTND